MIVARTTPAGVAEIGAPFCDAVGVVGPPLFSQPLSREDGMANSVSSSQPLPSGCPGLRMTVG
jgi:hypothetical protein